MKRPISEVGEKLTLRIVEVDQDGAVFQDPETGYLYRLKQVWIG